MYFKKSDMKKFLSLATLILTVVIVSSCASKKNDTNSNEATLFANNWRFVEIANVSIAKEVNGQIPYLTFDKAEQRYSAMTGCNTVNGTLETSNSKLKFGLGMSTMMFCENMTVENGFKQILEEVHSYKIIGNELVLMGRNETVLAKLNKYSN